MKAFKVMATINEQGQLTLDHPLITDKNSRVEVIVLIPEEEILNDQYKAIANRASLLNFWRPQLCHGSAWY